MSKNVMVTILGSIGMVCGTIISGIFIVHKDNKKIIDRVYEPIDKMVQIMEKYVDHTIKEEDEFDKIDEK